MTLYCYNIIVMLKSTTTCMGTCVWKLDLLHLKFPSMKHFIIIISIFLKAVMYNCCFSSLASQARLMAFNMLLYR